MFCIAIYNYNDTFLNMISLFGIHRTRCCPLRTGTTKDIETLVKLLTEAEEKREEYLGLHPSISNLPAGLPLAKPSWKPRVMEALEAQIAEV